MTFSRIPSPVPISEPQPFAIQMCLALSSGGNLETSVFRMCQMKAG